MSLVSWNCQGLRSTLTVQRLKEMRHEHFPDIMFLLETKNSSSHVLGVKDWMGYDHAHLVDPISLSGGLALFWKDAYKVEVLSADKRIIDTKIEWGSMRFYVMVILCVDIVKRYGIVLLISE